MNTAEVMASPGLRKMSNRPIQYCDIPEDNIDLKTVDSFGEEWKSFHDFNDKDIQLLGEKYFDIVDDNMLNQESTVIDIGCGSGRFMKYLAGKCKEIVGVEPSEAIFVADQILEKEKNVQLVKTSTDNLPFPDDHFDFGYSLGVLHHIPDTKRALRDCVKKIRPGGYFLLYLYYNLDNREIFSRILFSLSNLLRKVISKLPLRVKKITCDILAVLLYMPFVAFSRFLRIIGVPLRIRQRIPLQAYEDQRFYIIRNDSYDRFGTPLEARFSRVEIESMMSSAGLTEIRFSDKIPYWHAVGKKA